MQRWRWRAAQEIEATAVPPIPHQSFSGESSACHTSSNIMRSFLLSFVFCIFALADAFTNLPTSHLHRAAPYPTYLGAGNGSEEKPFAVVVQATIEPDRMAEFLTLIKTNAEQTRKEPGCIRFDVLRSQDSPNEFFFYELYKGSSAIDHHKKQPHYNLWADFKANGGVIESVSYKTDGEFLT